MRVMNETGGEGDSSRESRHSRIISSALDAAIDSNTQTYDQFLQGFIHLTASDVAPSVIQNAFGGMGAQPSPPPLFLQNNPSRQSSQSPPLFLQREPSPRLPPPPLADNVNTIKTDEDFEEVLDCCDDGPSRITRQPRAKSLQMDNYVVDEGSDAEDELSGSDYTASFTTHGFPLKRDTTKNSEGKSSVSPSPQTSQTDQPPASDHLPDINASDKQQSENDKQLENDSIKQSDKQIVTDNVSHTTNQSVSEGSSHGCHKLMDRITVNSVTGKKHAEDGPILDLIDDSEFSEDEELVYDPSLDRPNPGEVEEADNIECCEENVTNVREMSYSARMAEPGEIPSHTYTTTQDSADDGPVYDQVEAFSLDEDFDYDNVILTPKFTLQEQTELDGWARRGREHAEAERQGEPREEDS